MKEAQVSQIPEISLTSRTFWLGYTVLLFLCAGLALAFGAIFYPPEILWGVLTGVGDDVDRTILGLRLGRVIAAGLVGGALGLAGAVLQRLLRNPLADPYVLGISAGGTLAATVAVVVGLPAFVAFVPARVGYALVGCLATLFLILGLKRRLRRVQDEYAITVMGLVLNAFYGAMLMFVVSVSQPDQARRAYNLMIGSVEGIAPWPLAVVGGLVCVICIGLVFLAPAIHALSFGDDIARTVGFNAVKIRLWTLILVAVLVALVVSLAGSVGFVGLIVPHLARRLHGGSVRREWLGSLFLGAALLVIADLAGRLVVAPSELPAGLFAALVGAPSLAFMMIRRSPGV